jgi:hypothetical protein
MEKEYRGPWIILSGIFATSVLLIFNMILPQSTCNLKLALAYVAFLIIMQIVIIISISYGIYLTLKEYFGKKKVYLKKKRKK